MARITTITAAQEAELVRFHAEWLAVGTKTGPADRPRAEAAIGEMYEILGRERPAFLWFDSPATALLGGAILRQLRKLEELPLGASLRASLRDSLGASLGDSLGASLGASLRDSLWDSLWASLGASPGAPQAQSQLRFDWACYYGQHEGYWPPFYLFAGQVLGVRYDVKRSRQLHLWAEVSRSCGWWWPYEGVVLCTELPTELHMEPAPANDFDRGLKYRAGPRMRLHHPTRPAIAYADGWSVFAFHGVRVPEKVITAPETLTAKEITDEANAEVRRVMIERFTPERYLRESGARKLHVDDFGTLWRADFRDDEALVMVEVLNSTPEPDGSVATYWLRVHPELRPMLADGKLGAPQKATARNAVASTFGHRGEEYRPLVQT